MLQFPALPGLSIQRPNGEIAQDFHDLEFQMESGLALPVFTRFDGPITISMTGAVPPTARADLAHLIARLHAEAGLTLTRVADNTPATLTIAFERKAVLHRIEPTAACFVVPNVSSLPEYRSLRGKPELDWQKLRQRTRATLFRPRTLHRRKPAIACMRRRRRLWGRSTTCSRLPTRSSTMTTSNLC